MWRENMKYIYSKSLEVIIKVSLMLHYVVPLGRYKKQNYGRKP